jgi:pimeloyl-ACP methyl ester carboxylesterase
MTRFAVSKDGTKLAYDVVGQGPPLVYVMGAMGTRKIAFSPPMRDELAKSFTLYFYDRRGRGESGDNAPQRSFNVEREIEDLRAMVDVAGGDPLVVGSSSGAALALLAAAQGVPMRRLAAHEPPYAVGEHAATFDREYAPKVTRLVVEGRNDDAVKLFMRTVGVPAFMLWAMRLMPFWKDAVAAAPSLPYDANVMGDFAMPEKRLRAIRAPTVVIVGGSTPPRLRAAADATAKALGCREVVAPKQNHGIKPAAMRAALLDAFGPQAP